MHIAGTGLQSFQGLVGLDRLSEKFLGRGEQIVERGMTLHAGHGLTYRNVQPVARIPHMGELNIGHSIVARALMVGFSQAVREMKQLVS